ncbi:MAG: hypothetical protein AB7O88_29085 [Reyranellaceae bacterium]
MPVDPDAAIEIRACKWVPEVAHGLARDLRARWALEEAGLSTAMLRIVRHTGIVAAFPNLVRDQARCEARPAFQRALDAQIAVFKAHQPAAAAAQ